MLLEEDILGRCGVGRRSNRGMVWVCDWKEIIGNLGDEEYRKLKR